MQKLSNSKLISIVFTLLILVVIAKALSLGLWWYLPSDGVELNVKNNYQPKYQRVYCKNIITKAKIQQKKKEIVQAPTDGISITNMLLKGLYGTSSRAFVIVAMKDSPKKTKLVGLGEVFKGYTLKSTTKDSAIFEKGSKDYILTLEQTKSKRRARSTKKEDSFITPAFTADEPVGVSRRDIAHYAKNPKQIWRDISIKELRDGKKILGFKVTKIKRNSKFAQLGLQKGDLIIKANNVKLVSYKDALDIYSKIDKIDMIQIVVMRDNQEVELVYDIN